MEIREALPLAWRRAFKGREIREDCMEEGVFELVQKGGMCSTTRGGLWTMEILGISTN